MATATQTSKILSAEQEAKLRQPIDEYVGKIQAQIDQLRTDGTQKAVNIQNELDKRFKETGVKNVYRAGKNGT